MTRLLCNDYCNNYFISLSYKTIFPIWGASPTRKGRKKKEKNYTEYCNRVAAEGGP